MKKNLLAFVLIILCFGAKAQTAVTLPFTETFEDTIFPPSGWTFFSGLTNDSTRWTRFSDYQGGGYGRSSACMDFDNYDANGGTMNYFGIRLPKMDFTNVVQPYIRFDYAYEMRGPLVSDALSIYGAVTDDTIAGENFKTLSGDSLATDMFNVNKFVPPQFYQWKTITIPLLSLAKRPFARISFVDSSHAGNVVYVDNVIVFDSASTGVNTINGSDHFSVYPNPFDSQVHVFADNDNRISKVQVFNMLGGLEAIKEVEGNDILIDKLGSLPDGVYFLRIYSNLGVINRRLMKLHTAQ